MKRMFQVTALAAVLLLMSASAWSATYDDHVSQAGSGKGDVLIYPVYMAFDGGFQTKLQVINTSLDMSAVAKVVLRSPLYSQEVLDFLIFLSPSDMWEGYVQWDGAQVVVYTDDDSMLTSVAPTFASLENPISVPFQDPGCGDLTIFGYAEVFLAWVFPNLDTIPTPKATIYNAYVGNGTINAPAPTSGFAPAEFVDEFGVNPNILAGNLQIQNPVLGWSSALNATTLKNYYNEFALNPQAETIFGRDARNRMGEVEAALSKDWLAMPYINNEEGNTLHFFTFPTKLTRLDAECEFVTFPEFGRDYPGFGRYIGFHLNGTDQDSVAYNVRPMDMTEQTIRPGQPIFSPQPPGERFSFPWEVNVMVPDSFDKGWYLYSFLEGATDVDTWAGDYLEYTGVPVIPVVMNFGAGGFSTMYGASTDTPVYGDDQSFLEDYQWARVTPGT